MTRIHQKNERGGGEEGKLLFSRDRVVVAVVRGTKFICKNRSKFDVETYLP